MLIQLKEQNFSFDFTLWLEKGYKVISYLCRNISTMDWSFLCMPYFDAKIWKFMLKINTIYQRCFILY